MFSLCGTLTLHCIIFTCQSESESDRQLMNETFFLDQKHVCKALGRSQHIERRMKIVLTKKILKICLIKPKQQRIRLTFLKNVSRQRKYNLKMESIIWTKTNNQHFLKKTLWSNFILWLKTKLRKNNFKHLSVI